MKAVSEQIAAQAQQTRYVGEQTRLQTEQTAHVAEQTKLLARQAELLAETNKAILYQNVTKEMQHLSEIFLVEPQLRHYFYDGKPTPSDPIMRERVQILAEIFVDFMGFTLNTNVLFDPEENATWVRYFEYVTMMSPPIQEYWRQRRDWYEAPVRKLLDPIVATAVTRSVDQQK